MLLWKALRVSFTAVVETYTQPKTSELTFALVLFITPFAETAQASDALFSARTTVLAKSPTSLLRIGTSFSMVLSTMYWHRQLKSPAIPRAKTKSAGREVAYAMNQRVRIWRLVLLNRDAALIPAVVVYGREAI